MWAFWIFSLPNSIITNFISIHRVNFHLIINFVMFQQGDGTFPSVPMRGTPRDFMLYQQYMMAQEALGHGARIPYIPR